MDRDATTIKLERRVRKLTRVNRALLLRCKRAELALIRAQVEVDNVRDFMAETSICDSCRRALRSAARVELAA